MESILWNKDTESVKPQYTGCTLGRYYYVEQTWTCTKREENKIQAVEMKFVKAIMGKIKRARIRNANIREELRMEHTQNQIDGSSVSWFRHVKQMDEH
jgi:hypothetical protein